MRWFKHMTASHTDEKLMAYIDAAGLEGYGFWWLIMEIVASQMDSTDKCEVTYSLPQWSRLCYSHHNKVITLLGKLEVTGLITLSKVDGKIRVKIPNLLKYRDEYSKKSGHTPDKNPDTVRTKKQIQKQIQKEEKNTPPTPPPGGDVETLPTWLPREPWDAFVSMRKAIKKPMSDYAKKLAIGQLDKLRGQGNDPEAVLNQSTMNSWQGLFAVRGGKKVEESMTPEETARKMLTPRRF